MIAIIILSNVEFKEMKKKQKLKIHFGFHPSPFGKCLIGVLNDRVCHLSFVNDKEEINKNALEVQWPGCSIVENPKITMKLAEKVFGKKKDSVKVLLRGTEFEKKVWEALVKIPAGKAVSYSEVAAMAGREKAVRAAANAVAKNPVAYLVPCHRVIRKNGSLHKYGWGAEVKKKILQYENYC